MMYPKMRLFLSLFLFLGMTFLSTSPSFAPPFPSGAPRISFRGPITPISSTVNVTITINEPSGGLLGVMGDQPVILQRKTLIGTDNLLAFGPPSEELTARVISGTGASEVRQIVITLPRSYIPLTVSGASADVALTSRQRMYRFIWGRTPFDVTMPPAASTYSVTWTLSF